MKYLSIKHLLKYALCFCLVSPYLYSKDFKYLIVTPLAPQSKLQCKIPNLKNIPSKDAALPIVIQTIKELQANPTKTPPSLSKLTKMYDKSPSANLFILQMRGQMIAQKNKSIICKECENLFRRDFGFLENHLFSLKQASNHDKANDTLSTTEATKHLRAFNELDSYAILGESALCQGLKTKNANDFINAYTYFALSGLNVRALNALYEALKLENKEAAYLFLFLLQNDIYMQTNPLGAQMLEVFITQNTLKAAINNKSIFKNNAVLEFNGNLLENLGYIFLIDTGIVLPPQDSRFSPNDEEWLIENTSLHLQAVQDIFKQSYKLADSKVKKQTDENQKIIKTLRSVKDYPYFNSLKLPER
ncbi:hypothetical protein LS68_005505 [Helicobacter sp. MIT 05-5293]|uniref:hypothetical protein n=1 Tax=Helicobacter sp. MIT 05-5293 TaxID=1548149 RepID=UPI00051DA7A4|nr:hypothetical protein [Helicobacter sp. MIT 05-5293]TLD80927.1 hypothetical protein LS68_005505 [Helicobacter sp. MIT 05-5293]